MQQGWIKLHRKVAESPVFDNPNLLKVWIWCLCKVTHVKHEVIIGKQIIELQPGQFVFGRLKAAGELKMNDRTVYDYMKFLQKLEMIQMNPNNKFTLITIINWAFYQDETVELQQQNTQQPTIKDTQQNNTYKNDKNIKNEKKHIYGVFKKVRLTDSEKERLVADYGEWFFEACVKELDEYKEQTGKVYKNDNLAIRKWVVDAVQKKGGRIDGDSKAEQRSEYGQVSL